ncbi:MAG: hypothetical protein ACTSP3_03425 [Candidatus Heimdallarchaeaceae archaeon]
MKRVFNDTEVRFAAIDGTCYKQQMADYMVFFGGSYAVRGTVSLEKNNPAPKYDKWSSELDTSFVAYIPIPFAELSEITESHGEISGIDVGSDEQRIDLSNIHTLLMQLSEVFLAYDIVRISSHRPKYLLWDQSPSSILASTEVGISRLNLIGSKHAGRIFQVEDAIVAYSKPWNNELVIPSFKNFRIYNRVIFELSKNNGIIKISDILTKTKLTKEEFIKRIRNYLFLSKIGDTFKGTSPLATISDDTIKENPQIRINERWRYCVSLFEDICNQLFKEKDTTALLREFPSGDGTIRKKWLSPNDLRFIIAIGLRVLIEECWKNQVLLVGIVKDSSSKYLTRNYLNVLKSINIYDFEHLLIPWTDRMFLETIPYIDNEICSPWTTIEFDSVFMTLNSQGEKNKPESVHGVQGNVVNTENLFLRSLAQFYLSRNKKYPSTGHVIFVDRLAFPRRDQNNKNIIIQNKVLGVVNPLNYLDCKTENYMQLLNIYLLTILTRNLFPEVIGYPDPLHKADWGAKSIRKRVVNIIKSSELRLKSNPLKKRFRTLREEVRR